MNPNNCSTCQHKKNPDGGWCYMFRDEPTSVCHQHTGRLDMVKFAGALLGYDSASPATRRSPSDG